MKLNRLILAAFAALAVFACNKPEPEKEPEPKDTTPAELKSFALLKADNADILTEDVTVETIAPTMIVRIPGGGAGKTLVAAVTAGENDVIKANGKEAVDGKITFDASAPVDIIVTNTKSELTATYEVKVGKILATVVSYVGSYTEADAALVKDLRVAVNPMTKLPYILYSRKKTVDGTAEKNNRLAVIRWNGTAFEPVGTPGFTDVDRQAVMTDFAFQGETPYVLSYGETAASIMGVRKFNGSDWEPVGDKGFSMKINTGFGKPTLFFVKEKPAVICSGNPAKVGDVPSSSQPGYRAPVRYIFDGTAWNQTIQLTGFPTFGEKGGSDGYFYYGTTAVNSKGEIYLAASANLYGYYLYRTEDGNNWEKLVDNFIPEGETWGVPTNLSLAFGPSDVLYMMAVSSASKKEQLYRYNRAAKRFDAFAGPIEVGINNIGGADTPTYFKVNPVSGEVICVIIDPKDNNAAKFAVIDENRQWTDFKAQFQKPCADGDASLAMGDDGTAYFAYVSTDTAKNLAIELYKIGLEEDILPE